MKCIFSYNFNRIVFQIWYKNQVSHLACAFFEDQTGFHICFENQSPCRATSIKPRLPDKTFLVARQQKCKGHIAKLLIALSGNQGSTFGSPTGRNGCPGQPLMWNPARLFLNFWRFFFYFEKKKMVRYIVTVKCIFSNCFNRMVFKFHTGIKDDITRLACASFDDRIIFYFWRIVEICDIMV